MHLVIRTLTEEDLAAADEVIIAAYNPPPRQYGRIRRYVKIRPNDWVLALSGDRAVGIGGATHFGTFSYIGMVGVIPSMQGHGIGRAVMEELLRRTRARRIATVLLDATDVGAKLYTSLGFVEDDRALMLQRSTSALPPLPQDYSDSIAAMEKTDIAAVVTFDASYFGAERPAVLASYLADYTDRAFVARNKAGRISGFLIAQPNMIGPWMAETIEDAERLLVHALMMLPFDEKGPTVIIPARNREAERLLKRYGFSQVRSLPHMRLGNAVRRDRTKIYGQASFAIG